METETSTQNLDFEAYLQPLDDIESFDNIPFIYFREIANLVPKGFFKYK